MLTCKSPRKVMRTAYELAAQSLPDHTSKFSRRDFTLPQLLACLTVKEMLKRSYRGAEAVLRDCRHWCKDIGMRRVPDHNTLQRAAAYLLRKCHVDRFLDAVARWADLARVLDVTAKPVAVDATYFESHHVGRHFEHRRNDADRKATTAAGKAAANARRSETVKRLPKLALGVAAASHLILSYWTGTGTGSDHPHFEPVVTDLRRRVRTPRFTVVADAGYDSDHAHGWARRTMGLDGLIPPEAGRPPKDGKPPTSRWRRLMKRLLRDTDGRRRRGYTQRWQIETVNSMVKRNTGSALAGRSDAARERDMALKVITHNAMVV